MDNTVEQLNARKGQRVLYRDSWGNDAPETAILTGAEFSEDKGDIVVGVICFDRDAHWGYTYQIEFVEK